MDREEHVSLPVAAFLDDRLTACELRLLALIAQAKKHGQMSASVAALAQVLGVSPRSIIRSRQELVAHGYLAPGREQMKQLTLLAGAEPPAMEATDGFGEFYAAYPVKKARIDAQRAWKRLNPSAALQQRILADIAQRRQYDREWVRGFIPHPATYLNGRRWEDEIRRPTTPAGNRSAVDLLAEHGGFDDDQG